MSRYQRLLLLIPLSVALVGEVAAESGAPRQVTGRPLAELVTYPRSSAPAMVLSLNESVISAEIGATVEAMPLRVGDRVNKGDTLVVLACEELRLRHNQLQSLLMGAEARLEFSASQLERSASLRSDDNLSEELLQQRRADLKSAEAERAAATANLQLAALNVARCRVTAPFAGVVVARRVSEGGWVAPGTPLLTLLDSQRLELSAQIGLDEVAGLRQARQIEFVTQGQRYPVTLRTLPAKVESKQRQREARLIFADNRPLTGEVGRLEWSGGTPHLSADLPVRRGGKLGLFVIEQERARFVVLPDAIEGRAAVVTGVPDDAVVVIEGRQSLREGEMVKVVH